MLQRRKEEIRRVVESSREVQSEWDSSKKDAYFACVFKWWRYDKEVLLIYIHASNLDSSDPCCKRSDK